MIQPFWKTAWQFLTLNIFLPYNPAITLLSTYSKEFKTCVHTEIYTQMFIGALFIINKTWK